MDAKTAKQLSIQHSNEQLLAVYSKIQEECLRGGLSVYVDDLLPATKQALEEQGYKVKEPRGLDMFEYTLIIWK